MAESSVPARLEFEGSARTPHTHSGSDRTLIVRNYLLGCRLLQEREVPMVFLKTGVGLTPVRFLESVIPPEIGEERGGQVWDGANWVPKADWEATRIKPKTGLDSRG